MLFYNLSIYFLFIFDLFCFCKILLLCRWKVKLLLYRGNLDGEIVYLCFWPFKIIKHYIRFFLKKHCIIDTTCCVLLLYTTMMVQVNYYRYDIVYRIILYVISIIWHIIPLFIHRIHRYLFDKYFLINKYCVNLSWLKNERSDTTLFH